MDDEVVKLNLKIEIKRVADGIVATDVWPDWSFHRFWFEEGNASCDCNRELFFCRALKTAEPDDPECGDCRYLVRCSDSDTGEVLYDELGATPA